MAHKSRSNTSIKSLLAIISVFVGKLRNGIAEETSLYCMTATLDGQTNSGIEGAYIDSHKGASKLIYVFEA